MGRTRGIFWEDIFGGGKSPDEAPKLETVVVVLMFEWSWDKACNGSGVTFGDRM